MYKVTCDGYPLLDFRDDELILINPKVNLEVNTTGGSSFTIYKDHPNFDKLKKLKSVLEVSDDNGVIFRGRMTGDSVDFDHGMTVDAEGALAYFNDSVVRPFNFPDDYLEDAGYINACNNGNVVAYYLGLLIEKHNAQVLYFQQLKLGNVTVTSPDNYLGRAVEEIASTWEVLRSKLFDSSLGGYLCIRYEDDGNYVDYLSSFTETNSQEIAFGENLLDLNSQTEASMTYSAIIPVGALGLTIEGLSDGYVTSDIVKAGDTLYSESQVFEYGWIYAPVPDTTWDDVVNDADLLTKGAQWLANNGVFMNAMEAKAVDLHFTDEQVESIRIYKNVNVRSVPHDVSSCLPLAKLEIDLLKPQNTKITVGRSMKSLTEQNVVLQEETKKRYSKLSKTDESIRLEVQDELEKMSSSIDVKLENITLEVSSEDGSTTFTLKDGSAELSTETLDLYVKAANITGTLTADKIDASDLEVDAANITGKLTADQIESMEVAATSIEGKSVSICNSNGTEKGVITTVSSQNPYGNDGLGISSTSGALELNADGVAYIGSGRGAYMWLNREAYCAADFYPDEDDTYSCGGSNFRWSDIYCANSSISTSDLTEKKDVVYDLADYDGFFDILRPMSYRFVENTSNRKHIGFGAQDVEAALESSGLTSLDFAGFIKSPKEGGYRYGLRYGEFIALLVDQVQKLKSRVASLENVVAEMETKTETKAE